MFEGTLVNYVLDSLTNSLSNIIEQVILFIPGLIGATILLIIGYIISLVIGDSIKEVGRLVKLDEWLEKRNPNILGGIKLSYIVGQVIKWWIFVSFLPAAADLIGLPSIQKMALSLVTWFPRFIVGISIFIGGIILSDIASQIIEKDKTKYAKILKQIVKYSIIFFFTSVALREVNINISLIENTFLILVGGITMAISIAIGIALGFGLKKHSQKIIKKLI